MSTFFICLLLWFMTDLKRNIPISLKCALCFVLISFISILVIMLRINHKHYFSLALSLQMLLAFSLQNCSQTTDSIVCRVLVFLFKTPLIITHCKYKHPAICLSCTWSYYVCELRSFVARLGKLKITYL